MTFADITIDFLLKEKLAKNRRGQIICHMFARLNFRFMKFKFGDKLMFVIPFTVKHLISCGAIYLQNC